MIALDTNVLVRFLVRDDPKQGEVVRKRLQQAEGQKERLMIPIPVVLELIWVLESAYEKTRSEILDAIRDMRLMQIFEFETPAAIEGLLKDGPGHKADLSDILIARCAQISGADSGLTFDKKAARLPFFNLLKTEQ